MAGSALKRAWCAAALAASCVGSGCDTASEGLDDLLGGINTPEPSEAARWMFDQYDPDRRRTGALLIMNAPFGGEDVYVRQYRDMVINERDPIVKAIAIRALGRYGAPSDAAIIEIHLTHENEQVRWEAAKAMQRLHNPGVVGTMLLLLRDDQQRTDIRVALADGLGQYAEDRVFQALVAALDQRELAVNVTANESLTTLTGQDFGLDQAQWLRWYNQTRAAGENPFALQEQYLYPTYQRDPTFFEKLAIWSQRTYEQPGPPAGVEQVSERSTYGEEDVEGPSPGSGR